MGNKRDLTAFSAFMMFAGIAHGETWPNASGSCSASLQSCINAVPDGSAIVILGSRTTDGSVNPYNIINENITIARNLTLTGSNDVDVVFASGRNIVAFSVDRTLILENFKMIRGEIRVTDAGGSETSVANIQIRNVRFHGSKPNGACSIGINKIVPLNPASMGSYLEIKDNVIDFQNDMHGFGGICISSSSISSPAVVANNEGILIQGNRIIRRQRTASHVAEGIQVDLAATGPGSMLSTQNEIRILANTIVGPFANPMRLSAIDYARRNASVTATIAGNIIANQDLALGTGAVTIINEDSTLTLLAINNSIVNNRNAAIALTKTGALGTSTVHMANNLVAFNDRGIIVNGPVVFSLETHNLFHDTGVHTGFSPNLTTTITLNPFIEAAGFPELFLERFSGGRVSPAVDAGLNSAIPPYISWDNVGEKRVIGSAVDIGALEKTSDIAKVVEARLETIDAASVAIDPAEAQMDLRNEEYIIATPICDQPEPPSEAALNFGIYRQSSAPETWRVFHQSSAHMSLGEKYSVLIPYSIDVAITGVVGKYGYRHTTAYSVETGGDSFTTLANSRLEGNPYAIAIATARFENPVDAPVGANFHDHPIGLEYGQQIGPGGMTHAWRLNNEDGITMTSNSGEIKSFNILIATAGSPNAFGVRSTALGQAVFRLDHPLLNDNPCAAPIIGRNNSGVGGLPSVRSSIPYALKYQASDFYGGSGKWMIIPLGGATEFPAQTGFNVIIDGTQSGRCLSQLPTIDLLNDDFE